jgi:hypothetical protein
MMNFLFALFLVDAHRIRKPVSFIPAKPYVRPPTDYFWDSCNVTDCTYCVPFQIGSYFSPNDTINGITIGNKRIYFC